MEDYIPTSEYSKSIKSKYEGILSGLQSLSLGTPEPVMIPDSPAPLPIALPPPSPPPAPTPVLSLATSDPLFMSPHSKLKAELEHYREISIRTRVHERRLVNLRNVDRELGLGVVKGLLMGPEVEIVTNRIIKERCRHHVRRRKKKLQLSNHQENYYVTITEDKAYSDEVIIDLHRIEITARLLSCLKNGQWLNDEVVNFYFQLIKARSLLQNKKMDTLSSFFYTKLTGEGYNYNSVRRWTIRQKIDIFDLDLFVFPINLSNVHWVLGAVLPQKKQILYLDSNGGRGSSYFSTMRRYLADEHENKKKSPLDLSEWTDSCPYDIPQQTNGYVFCLFNQLTLV